MRRYITACPSLRGQAAGGMTPSETEPLPKSPLPGDGDVGHIFIYVRNDKTGESAYFDYLPNDDERVSILNQVRQSRIDETASITIETTAEQEQAILITIRYQWHGGDDVEVVGIENPKYKTPR